MDKPKPELSDVTIMLMIGTALLFDGIQILLSWFGGGWLVMFVAYPTFIVWFWMKGINFISRKKALVQVAGAALETLTAGIVPGFTVVVSLVALENKVRNKVGI